MNTKPQAQFSQQVIDRVTKRVAKYLESAYGVDSVGAVLLADRFVHEAASIRGDKAQYEDAYLLGCDHKVSYLVLDCKRKIWDIVKQSGEAVLLNMLDDVVDDG